MSSPFSLVRRCSLVLALGAFSAPLSAYASTHDLPRGPIRIVVPYPPGAATDALARKLAAQLALRLDRQVVVENKPGSNTIIGTGFVARAAPDGNTLLLTVNSHASNHAVYRKLPYDSQKDFEPVGLIGLASMLIAVHPDFPAKNVAELLALTRSTPDKVKFGTAGHGSPPHLAGELLNAAAGVTMTHVPYKGGAPAMNDVLAGHIPMLIGGLATIAPNVRSGRLRAIAVTTRERSAVLPDTPSLAESGLPVIDIGLWYALLTSADTSRPIRQRINRALNETLEDPEFRKDLLAMGIEPKPASPDELGALIRHEIKLWSDLVERSRIERIE